MTYFKFVKKYRMFSNLSRRFIKIFRRYDSTGRKMMKNIIRFIQDCSRFDICPTFPTTAQVIDSHFEFFKQFDKSEVEIALHGFYFKDHISLTLQEKKQLLNRNIMKFYEAGIPIYGIRFPYLRADEPCLKMAKELSIDYDNSCPFWWNVNGWDDSNNIKIIEKMKQQYNPSLPEEDFVLPFFENSLVRIPASLPDDDLLWDRAGLNMTMELENVWKEILRRTMERNELFVLILHPERYEFLRSPFLGILKEIKEQKDKVWVRPLRDISEWWQKRAQAYIECEFTGNRMVKIQIQRPRELNYVFYNFNHSRNIKLIGISHSDFVIEEFEVRMPAWPVIGLGPKTSTAFREMLKNLGFWVDEETGFPEIYSVYFEEDPVIESRYQWVQDFLANNKSPLIRFNNWPENFKSAFAVTGDIDAMTRQDFFSRI